MKIRNFTLIAAICVLLASCTDTASTKCGPCPLMAQLAPFINVRIVDKTTGADLFLSPASPYKLSDLKVNSSVNGTDVSLFVDSTQKDNRFIKIIGEPSQTFTLKLSTLPVDSIRVAIKADSPKCCPVVKIKEIWLNGVPVCNPCNYDRLITIKK